MRGVESTTPAVVLGAGIGALGIMRSLGRLGVRVACVDPNPDALPFRSRYCREKIVSSRVEEDPDAFLKMLVELSDRLGPKPILYWTSDELALFCAGHADVLRRHYLFPDNTFDLVQRLQDKCEMSSFARDHGVSTPDAAFPSSEQDVEIFLARAQFPIMIKGIVGSRLQARTGEKMKLVQNAAELRFHYHRMEDTQSPNLMLQEAIPGDDDEVYIFNGYFDEASDCLNPFTGQKLRQHPIHTGCASLGINRWNPDVAALTMRFMKEIGYRGILDIGYRLDPRDGEYKVLDINPRIGQAFRIFVGEDGTDVARDMYLDLTGQARAKTVPREGRRWVIEDWDLSSSKDYWVEGTLTFGQWVASLRGLQEGAWWSWRDPIPFLHRMTRYLSGAVARLLRRMIGSLSIPETRASASEGGSAQHSSRSGQRRHITAG